MSEWSVGTLKEYFEALRADDKEALQAALVAVHQENRKSEVSAEKRFDLLNELRTGVATKDQLEALEKVVNDLKDRLNTSQGQSQGAQLTKGNIYTAVGVGSGVIIAALALIHFIK